MKKLSPKKKIYLTVPSFELEVSYTFKGQHHKTSYVFDDVRDFELFANEAVSLSINKGFQNIHISMYRKELYYDSKINEKDVKETVKKEAKTRKKRIEETPPW